MDEPFEVDVGSDMEESTQSTLHIPTELCESIIDMLYSGNASDTFEDMSTLRSCSLVCRSWRVRAQRMLFYKVQLSDGVSLRRLSAILDTGQHLRGYVHEVVLVGHFLQTTASILPLFPVVFSGKLPNLYQLDIGSLQESDMAWFLSSFTGISHILLYSTTFRSFSEFARMLHGLPNLENLACSFVRWLTPGGSYPGTDITSEPEWLPDGRTLPPFAPKLRRLWFRGIATYGADKLVRTRGPHLTWLSLGVPLPANSDEPAHGQDMSTVVSSSIAEGKIDLSSCSGLRTLDISLTPEFSKDPERSLDEFRSILTSWKPRHPKPFLELKPFGHTRFTRETFTEILYALGPVVDTWLRTVEELSLDVPADGDPSRDTLHGVKYQLAVEIHDWEAEREWWSDHIASCFPTWLRLGRLHMDFSTRKWTSGCGNAKTVNINDLDLTALNKQWEWKAEEEEEEEASTSQSQPEPELDTSLDLR
ncbi:hypothetical protein GSI_05098 [Ganoderma sinense ZZ0214-1]|uniref:Uncharacterized protein n=1 Tax=Ganoderma sinense ZZ0214-1 TaxID=1077348 RepID=A0A2G8SGT0_9APHY|nr:hypothetical protein GSI_05098 [Ganoderma sinense ZZ0214-1]